MSKPRAGRKKNSPPRTQSPLDWCHICNRYRPCYHSELTEAQKRNDEAGLPYIEAHVNAVSQANAFYYSEVAALTGDRWAVNYWNEQAKERRKEARILKRARPKRPRAKSVRKSSRRKNHES